MAIETSQRTPDVFHGHRGRTWYNRNIALAISEKCQPPDVARTEPQEVFDRNRTVIHELLQTAPPAWIYMDGCQHIIADQTLALLADAFAQQANLTLNTGPLPDGSIQMI